MSFHEGTEGVEVRPRPDVASPLNAAISAQDRETLSMVAAR
jgi:alpha-D-ribose 1-methylphosphonate 5-triphosphate diphosphatase PhnM